MIDAVAPTYEPPSRITSALPPTWSAIGAVTFTPCSVIRQLPPAEIAGAAARFAVTGVTSSTWLPAQVSGPVPSQIAVAWMLPTPPAQGSLLAR